MLNVLLKVDTLAYYLRDKGSKLSYYDDFDEAVYTYPEDFMDMIDSIANIAQSKENIAKKTANYQCL